jgi:hypothetical protein
MAAYEKSKYYVFSGQRNYHIDCYSEGEIESNQLMEIPDDDVDVIVFCDECGQQILKDEN